MSYDLALVPTGPVDLAAQLRGVEGVQGAGRAWRFEGPELFMGIDLEADGQLSFHIPYAFWSKAKAHHYMGIALPLAQALGVPLRDLQLDEVVDRVDFHAHRGKRVGAVYPIGLDVAGSQATVRGFYASYTWHVERFELLKVGPAVEVTRSESPRSVPGLRVVHWVRSPCGRWLALSLSNKRIRVVDPTGALRCEISRCGRVRAMAFSADGERLLSGSDNKSVKIWSCGTGKALCTLKGHEEQVMGVAWLGGGRVLSHSRWSMRIWEPSTKRCVRLMAATMGHEWLSWGPQDWRTSPGFLQIRWDNDARKRIWRPGVDPLALSERR